MKRLKARENGNQQKPLPSMRMRICSASADLGPIRAIPLENPRHHNQRQASSPAAQVRTGQISLLSPIKNLIDVFIVVFQRIIGAVRILIGVVRILLSVQVDILNQTLHCLIDVNVVRPRVVISCRSSNSPMPIICRPPRFINVIRP